MCVPGLTVDLVEDSLRFISTLKKRGKKISGTNGLLWLISREDLLSNSHPEQDNDEDSFEKEEEEEALSDDEEYSEERDPTTGLSIIISAIETSVTDCNSFFS